MRGAIAPLHGRGQSVQGGRRTNRQRLLLNVRAAQISASRLPLGGELCSGGFPHSDSTTTRKNPAHPVPPGSNPLLPGELLGKNKTGTASPGPGQLVLVSNPWKLPIKLRAGVSFFALGHPQNAF